MRVDTTNSLNIATFLCVVARHVGYNGRGAMSAGKIKRGKVFSKAGWTGENEEKVKGRGEGGGFHGIGRTRNLSYEGVGDDFGQIYQHGGKSPCPLSGARFGRGQILGFELICRAFFEIRRVDVSRFLYILKVCRGYHVPRKVTNGIGCNSAVVTKSWVRRRHVYRTSIGGYRLLYPALLVTLQSRLSSSSSGRLRGILHMGA